MGNLVNIGTIKKGDSFGILEYSGVMFRATSDARKSGSGWVILEYTPSFVFNEPSPWVEGEKLREGFKADTKVMKWKG